VNRVVGAYDAPPIDCGKHVPGDRVVASIGEDDIAAADHPSILRPFDRSHVAGNELAAAPAADFIVAAGDLGVSKNGNLPANYPGCLAAAFCYQDQLFSKEVRKLNAEGMLVWRSRFRERFERIAASYAPRRDVDLDTLADSVLALVEGGLILGRVLGDPSILPRQILLFRDYVRAAFSPDRTAIMPQQQWRAARAA